MIILREQHGYKNPSPIPDIGSFVSFLKNETYRKSIQKGENPAYCYQVIYSNNPEQPYLFETSYFVGVDWLIENKLPIHVAPKLNQSGLEIDYFSMLFQAMRESSNQKHLNQLFEIYYNKPQILIEQKQDILTPILIIQFLSVLKEIVRKGIKKSYYAVNKNLNAKIKGRILINDTIKKNHFNNRIVFSQCKYEEFGVNNIENKILKRCLEFSIKYLSNQKGFDLSYLFSLINFIHPSFAEVNSEINVEEFKKVKINKLYKEYEIALELADNILKRYGYNISSINSNKINTPPFWIDMSKLFELYVYSKLKELFPLNNEVEYHKKVNYLEPDFLVKSKDNKYKLIIDAKYKPQYLNGKISTDDIRQISGYARLEKIYDYLEIEKYLNIDCLVIYSNQEVERMNFVEDNFNFEKEENYVNFYKIGLKLPIINQ